MKTYLPLIIQMPQEHIASAIFCRLVPLDRLLKKDYAKRLKQDIDGDITVDIYHWEYVPKFGGERWVRVLHRQFAHRTINTYADIEMEYFKLWEAIPDEWKREYTEQ